MKSIKARGAIVLGLFMLVAAACSDGGELDAANSQITDLEGQLAALEAANDALEGNVADLEAQASALEDSAAALDTEKNALEAVLADTGQELILQADIVGDGCMLQNSYLNDGERKATFRVRVYDPITGEQMDDTLLESVTVEIDGNSFDLAWGPHPPNTEDDFFWTYGWEIFEGYPAGNIEYTISAVSKDGRSGQFDPFMVAPSLLTVVDVAAAAA